MTNTTQSNNDSTDGSHPGNDTLQQYSLGQLETNSIDEISRHIESCAICINRLKQWEANETVADKLLLDLRQYDLSDGGFHVESGDIFESQIDPAFSAIESLGKYRVLEKLGAGGMGSIFLAEHLVMKRQVAIKTIRKELVANPEAVVRFQNEVRLAARLSHRNIVTAHDAEQANGVHFLVMEYVPGESLSQLVRRKGQLPLKRACNYILQVAHGLNHAHKNGMVHRDIKPGNLMRTPRGAIKILDFGLARISDSDSPTPLTTTGVMMGTADYVAPEQARDAKNADIRSDLYSLGCTFYFLLTNQPPFQDETKVDKIIAHCSNQFPDASRERADLPVGVLKIIDKLTAKDPIDRYQTPKELIDDLSPYGNPRSGNPQPEAPTKVEAAPVAPIVVVEPRPKTSSKSLTSQAAKGSTRRKFHWALVSIVALGILCPLAWFFLPPWLFPDVNHSGNGGNENRIIPEGLANTLRTYEGFASDQPTVLLVMSSQKFWFSDYKPIENVLKNNNINLIVTADQPGYAKFNPSGLDTFPDKHSVRIRHSVSELVKLNIDEAIDAVVFIGTDTREFRGNDDTGLAIQKLLTQLSEQNKWITSLGKGSEIPIQFGIYDGVEVCDSRYLEPGIRNLGARLIAQRVHEVTNSQVLTGAMWDDADEFAKKLIQILRR